MLFTYIFKQQRSTLGGTYYVNYRYGVEIDSGSTIREAMLAIQASCIHNRLVTENTVDTVRMYYKETIPVTLTSMFFDEMETSDSFELGGELLPLDVLVSESLLAGGGYICCISDGSLEEEESEEDVSDDLDFESYYDTLPTPTRNLFQSSLPVITPLQTLLQNLRDNQDYLDTLNTTTFQDSAPVNTPLQRVLQDLQTIPLTNLSLNRPTIFNPVPETGSNLLNFIFGGALRNSSMTDVQVGLDQDQLRQMPRTTFDKFRTQSGDTSTSNEACTICLERYVDNTEVLVLPCNHIFHPECIEHWFQSSVRCPVCRGEAGEGQVMQE